MSKTMLPLMPGIVMPPHIYRALYEPEHTPDQDLRCLARYAATFNACKGNAVVGPDGTVRVVDYPVRQAWVLPEPPAPIRKVPPLCPASFAARWLPWPAWMAE